MADLYTVVRGEGEPVVFVHGSSGWGTDTFPEQLSLADEYQVVLVDRRGFGDSPGTDRPDFDVDAEDVVAVLGPGGHLVGQSYGAVSCLLAAARSPEVVWSLTVIEPPALGLLRGDEVAEQLTARWAACYERAADMTPEEFYACFLRAFGTEVDLPLDPPPTEKDLAAFVSTMNERPLWEARLPLDELARAPFPKLVVSGDWFTRSELARELAGRTFNRVCDVIAERTGAERVVFPGAAHNPQLEQPEAFNRRLRDLPRYGRRSARRRPLNRGPGAVYHLSERRE